MAKKSEKRYSHLTPKEKGSVKQKNIRTAAARRAALDDGRTWKDALMDTRRRLERGQQIRVRHTINLVKIWIECGASNQDISDDFGSDAAPWIVEQARTEIGSGFYAWADRTRADWDPTYATPASE